MSEVKVDTISERTAANGVAVDGVTIKDSGLTIPSGGTLTVASGGTITNSGTATGFGGDNTPSFSGNFAANTTITNAVWTKLAFDTAEWDTDSAFDITTNKGRFTVPAGEGGKYVFHGGAGGFVANAANDMLRLRIYKNGSAQTNGGHGSVIDLVPATGWDNYLSFNATMLLSAGDYVELYVYQNLSTDDTFAGVTYFSGFKLVGV